MRAGQAIGSVSCALAIAAVLHGCGSEPEKHAPFATATQTLGQSLAGEIEPNPDAARATAIENDSVVRANIFPSGDVDYYRFTGQAGDRVYAATMTNFSAADADSVLSVVGPDGTVLEEDNNNGMLAEDSSSIAGTVLPATGTYYVRVAASSASIQIRPYDLHFRLRSGDPVAEVEPNDGLATAQPIGSGWVSGSSSGASDLDLYSFSLNAGDSVYAGLDLDPERDGTSFNGTLAIGAINGRFLSVNNTGAEGGPDSESNFITVKNSGTYYVLVVGASSGTYQLNASIHPSTPTCTTYTSSTEVAIPEGPGLVTATLDVPDDVLIGDVNVNLRFNHDLPADLDVHLVAPGGNEVGLFSDPPTLIPPSTLFTAFDLTLDDEAAVPLGPFASSIAGTLLQPEQSYRLHWFDGQQARGTWTLKIWDDAATHGGTLISWGLSICAMPPRAECPSGTVATTIYGTDFEADDGSFTHSSASDQWARGTPSGASAPILGCASGVNCFKTNLAGRYAASSSSDLVSPSIDLAGVQAPITVQWAQAYQLENAQLDHASVDVRRAGGTDPTRLFEFLDPTMQDGVGNPLTAVQESAGWGIRRADISAYTGTSIDLLFHQDASAATELSGFAIDDVSVIGCVAPCGNGQVEVAEQCDDGNAVSGDCCSATCQFEICMPRDECHVAGTCDPSSGCSDPPAPDATVCSNGMCQGGRCIADGMGGAGGDAGAGGDSGAGGSSGAAGEGTSGRGGTAGTSSAGEGGAGATGGSGGTSTGGNGGAGAGRDTGGTSAGGNGPSEGGEAGAPPGDSSPRSSADESSCGCSTVGRRSQAWTSLALAALLVVARRRRAKRSFNRVGATTPAAARARPGCRRSP